MWIVCCEQKFLGYENVQFCLYIVYLKFWQEVVIIVIVCVQNVIELKVFIIVCIDCVIIVCEFVGDSDMWVYFFEFKIIFNIGYLGDSSQGRFCVIECFVISENI